MKLEWILIIVLSISLGFLGSMYNKEVRKVCGVDIEQALQSGGLRMDK